MMIIVTIAKMSVVFRAFRCYVSRRRGTACCRRRCCSLVLGLLKVVYGRLIAAYGAELVAHDCEDEEAVEKGNDCEDDRVKDFGFLGPDVSRDRVENPRSEDDHDARARNHAYVNQKLDKVFLIPFPHAIVYPRAVMIHTTNTALTDPAMMSSRWAVSLTLRTQRPPVWTLSIIQILITQIDGSVGDGDDARVGEDRPQMRNHHESHENVKADDEEGPSKASVQHRDD